MAEPARKIDHIPGVLNIEELRELLGLERNADVRRVLEKQGIACFDGKNGVWTTMDLVKTAGLRKLGLADSSNEPQSML